MFYFIGGYGIWVSSKGKKFDIVGRIKKLYISYWKVFLIFIPIAFLFFSNQPIYCKEETICSRYSTFLLDEFINNLLGVSNSYNSEWWFFWSYIVAVVLFPFIKYIVEKNPVSINFAIVIVVTILFANVFPAIGTVDVFGGLNSNYFYRNFFGQNLRFACFWMGCVFAKDDLLIRLKEALLEHRLLNPFLDIIFIGFIIYARQMIIKSYVADSFLVPLFNIFIIDIVNRITLIRKTLIKLGEQSTNMWLIHSFFCYYFYAVAKIVVALKWAIFSLIVLIGLTYIASILVTCFWKTINWVYINICTLLKKIVYNSRRRRLKNVHKNQ